ncbi:MAG: hypothetical protein RL748_2443 [Pseudomonadota bacterium]|jgi:hypothetical protein
MNNFRHHRRQLTAWIAAFAILCQTLLPVLAQARMSSAPDAVLELCTSDGIQKLTLIGDKLVPMKQGHTQHCPFCLAGGFVAFNPPDSPSLPPLVAQSFPYLQSSTALRSKLRDYATPVPRGPPA